MNLDKWEIFDIGEDVAGKLERRGKSEPLDNYPKCVRTVATICRLGECIRCGVFGTYFESGFGNISNLDRARLVKEAFEDLDDGRGEFAICEHLEKIYTFSKEKGEEFRAGDDWYEIQSPGAEEASKLFSGEGEFLWSGYSDYINKNYQELMLFIEE